MLRRRFIKGSGLGLAAAGIAAPAIAQGTPELKWRLTSSFPKSIDTLWGGAELFCKRIGELTDGRFHLQPFAAGEIVPGFQVLDAVQNGTVEIGQSAGAYYVGKDPTFAFDTAMPFGMNSRQLAAWLYHGGGGELIREFYKDFNVMPFPFGNTGAQMGGWFRKEIKSVEDMKGLKFRIAGLGGNVMQALGAVTQQIPGGDIYPALEKGTIDGAEWVGPYDDEKLGFNKIAQYYYYPGWWEGTGANSIYVNLKKWEELPPAYQAAIRTAAGEISAWLIAKYDALNPAALRRLVAGGTQLRPFPRPVLDAAYKAAHEMYADMAAKNAKFKKVYDNWKHFRDEEILWFRVAEQGFDNYMATQSGKA